MEREKALEMALGQITKQYGEGAVMRMDDSFQVKVPAIPTGAISLDLALGIGGIPRGRVIEVYGPESSGKTSLALHMIAETQKAGGIAAFIDAEHALDPTYAKAIGVDMEELLVSQPDTGEQALEITDMLIRSGAIDIVVIDSVAALTPRAEIEGEMGDSHVGLQARLMSQALRKLSGNLHRSKTSAVFINQLREKIGVLFGCFDESTPVMLADGTQEKIGKIVDERLPVEVLSYDPELGKVVPKKVTNWFNNGPTEEFLTFAVARAAGYGPARFTCTPNHQIHTPSGWKEAQELSVGDRVLQSVPHYLSDFQWEVVLGALMGDGTVSPNQNGLSGRLRWGHGAKQAGYADWKASLFANIDMCRTTNDKGAVFYDARPLPELRELREAVYFGGKKVLSWDYLKRLTPLSLAIWYMDDAGFTIRSKGLQARTSGGSGRAEICVEALEETSRQRLADHLRDEWGLDTRLHLRGKRQVAVLTFTTASTDKLQALIAPYVHPSMEYKLLPRHRGKFDVQPEFAEMRHELVPMPILDIHRKPRPADGRTTYRYDIEVDGTHNYFVDGVMVHNSPETQPGGRALKFYSSVRLDIRRIESLKDGTDFVGNRVRVKVVKNKCVAAGTRVYDPATGLTHKIEDVVDDGVGGHVWAADKQGQLHIRSITNRFDQGEQDVIGLRLRNGTHLRVTSDHLILTETGWRQAGELAPGDRVARPRRAGGFGESRPVTTDQARMLGYLIGDGYVGGKTPIAFINTEAELHDDAARIAADHGCKTSVAKDGIYASFSHRKGEKNGLLELTRWAGIYGHLAPAKKIPAALLGEDMAEDVAGNLLFGIWESDGWISREQTGGIRLGFGTTSEQLAWQIHWLLLRWGVSSAVKVGQPGERRSLVAGRRIQGKLPFWQVRVSGIDNVRRFAEALPMWGPKGQKLTAELENPVMTRHRGARTVYLSSACNGPILEYLERRGVTGAMAANMLALPESYSQAGLPTVLGKERMRRDRIERLAEALDSSFLREMLGEELYYERIHEVTAPQRERTFDIEVEELHNFVADDVVVHNCASPFKTAEFDILFGEGISKEGSLIDVGVEHGIVKKAGAWYTYDGEQLGQGRENARNFLKEHEDTAAEIAKKINEALGLVPTDVVGEDNVVPLPEAAEDE